MGKKKRGFNQPKANKIDKLESAVSSDEGDGFDDKIESMLEDEIDKYNALRDQELLEGDDIPGIRKRQLDDSDDEEEVYGLDISDDDYFDEGQNDDEKFSQEDDDDDDIIGKDNEDGVPDARAWGRKSKTYFNTDYVDKDFGGFEGSDAELAEQEETEAQEIRNRLIEELDDDDFLDYLPMNENKGKKRVRGKEVLKVDVKSMTNEEKIKFLERECPEIINMLEEYKEKLKLADEIYQKRNSCDENSVIGGYYETLYQILMNYCINMSYFWYLRVENPAKCKTHPVLKKILQFKKLLHEIQSMDTSLLGEEVIKDEEKPTKRPRSDKRLRLNEEAVEMNEKLMNQTSAENTEHGPEDVEIEEETKRKITYQMAKNKGLTPYRKKELKNPRVKHKIKFRKANIRRKGQVRKPRTELQKYGGELCGIKANVTKSIKLQ